mmetsp:Transcript_36620/g.88259  ORF Transcript_36620/g.88259 Transcript_36620/m.88259 type:complete len:85 (-) Transcript_36620:387-641(-)
MTETTLDTGHSLAMSEVSLDRDHSLMGLGSGGANSSGRFSLGYTDVGQFDDASDDDGEQEIEIREGEGVARGLTIGTINTFSEG